MVDRMNLDFIITQLKPVMRKAGHEIMKIYKVGVQPHFKEDGSPVTLADKRSEEILVTALRDIVPKTPIISEENPDSHTLAVNQEYFLGKIFQITHI